MAKRLRDNDVEAHTGNQVYSCGSLAPKLRKGGGCMDHGFKRAQQVWEGSDGAVYLLRELAEFGGEEKRSGPRRGLSAGLAMIRGEMAGAKPVADAAKADTAAEAAPAPEAEAKADAAGEDAEGHQNLTAEELSAAQAAARKGVMELLPMLADIASVQHFTHAVQLQETIWKQLPVIMKVTGGAHTTALTPNPRSSVSLKVSMCCSYPIPPIRQFLTFELPCHLSRTI